jgi:hypothetical protein
MYPASANIVPVSDRLTFLIARLPHVLGAAQLSRADKN